MTGNLSEQVRAYVRQIEAIEDEIAGLNTDKSEIYKSAKDAEIDVKALRRVVAYRRKRGKGADVEAEEQAFAEYLHMVENGLVRARVEIVEEIPPHDAAFQYAGNSGQLPVHDAETGELLDEAAETEKLPAGYSDVVQGGASFNAGDDAQAAGPVSDAPGIDSCQSPEVPQAAAQGRNEPASVAPAAAPLEDPDLPDFLDRRAR